LQFIVERRMNSLDSIVIQVWGSIIVIVLGLYFKIAFAQHRTTIEMLRFVVKQMGLSNPLDIEIQNLKTQGKKIDAIKKARKFYGLTLREAKDYVDSL
jgi:hypothetical protein